MNIRDFRDCNRMVARWPTLSNTEGLIIAVVENQVSK